MEEFERKLKLGLELKQKSGMAEYVFFPWPWNSWVCCSSVVSLRVLVFPWPWNSWVCCSSVDSVRGSCFNSQFFDSEIGKSSAESEIMRGKWFSGRQVKIVSQNKQRGEVLTLNRFLLCLQLYFWGNRKFYSLPSTFKAEARFRVKTKTNRLFYSCNYMQTKQEMLFVAFNFQSWSSV